MAAWEVLAPRRDARGRPRGALAEQSRHRCGRRAGGAAAGSGGGRRRLALCRRPRHRAVPLAQPAALGRGAARVSRPRSRHLRPARRVPSCAVAVAAAPHAPRRPRHRRDHRVPLSSVRNSDLARHQDRRRRWRSASRRSRCSSSRSCSTPPRCSTTPTWRCRRGSIALVRLVLVTPDMHRVHHSIVRAETDSNFGFNLPWWDRLFGTYRREPQAGHDGMTIGLPVFRDRQGASPRPDADAAVPAGWRRGDRQASELALGVGLAGGPHGFPGVRTGGGRSLRLQALHCGVVGFFVFRSFSVAPARI